MRKDDCFYLGSIAKTKGLKGEVVVFLDVDFPEEYKELESAFVEINQQLIPFFVERFQLKQKGFANVKFEDVNSEEQAKRLVKSSLYLPLNQLPELGDNQFYYHEIEGFEVVDTNYGTVGTVDKVLDYPGNPIIQITKDYKEVLIPITNAVIQSVDRTKQTIHVTVPDGLIDLYLGDESHEFDE